MPNIPTQKQPVFGSRGVVAANQPIASAAGIAMLAAGGNVADAAVATAFTCGVVEPQMVGPMGGGYIVFRDAAGETLVIDNYAEAAAAATDTLYEPDEAAGFGMVKGDKNQTGHLATGVPGNAKGWLRLHELKGRLPIGQVLQPAIAAAEHGFEISPYLQYSFHNTQRQLAMFEESAKIFLLKRQGAARRPPSSAAGAGRIAAYIRQAWLRRLLPRAVGGGVRRRDGARRRHRHDGGHRGV